MSPQKVGAPKFWGFQMLGRPNSGRSESLAYRFLPMPLEFKQSSFQVVDIAPVAVLLVCLYEFFQCGDFFPFLHT